MNIQMFGEKGTCVRCDQQFELAQESGGKVISRHYSREGICLGSGLPSAESLKEVSKEAVAQITRIEEEKSDNKT